MTSKKKIEEILREFCHYYSDENHTKSIEEDNIPEIAKKILEILPELVEINKEKVEVIARNEIACCVDKFTEPATVKSIEAISVAANDLAKLLAYSKGIIKLRGGGG